MIRTCPNDGGGETTKRSTGMATIREKETRQTQTYRAEGIRGMMGEKGLKEEDWADRNNWRGRLHNCEMGAGRCGNIVQPAK
jgi:hypothetical protein